MTQILFFLLALILFSVTTLGINYLTNSQKNINPSDSKNESEKNETSKTTKKYKYNFTNYDGEQMEIEYLTKNLIDSDLTIDGRRRLDDFILESSTPNETVFLVVDGGVLHLRNVNITKLGDSNVEYEKTNETDFYRDFGINSAIVVLGNGTLLLDGVNILTNSSGANSIVANGGFINVVNSSFETKKEFSKGFITSCMGAISAKNVTIITNEFFSSCINIGMGSGLIDVENSNLNSKARFSPLFYSTGQISAINCTGNTKNSQIGIIKGCSSLLLNNNDFKKYNDIIFANKTLRNLQINNRGSYDSDSHVAIKIEGDEDNENQDYYQTLREQNTLRHRFAGFATCFCRSGLSNYESKGYIYDDTKFSLCKKNFLENSIFNDYIACMQKNKFNNTMCKGLLPEFLRHIESINDLRNLASYETSMSLLEFDNTTISYELKSISENEEEIDSEKYELWKAWGLIKEKENEVYNESELTISLIKVEGNINSAINFNSSDIKINYDEDDSFLKEKNEIQVCILNAENDEKTENISSINLIVENIAFSSNNNENKTIKASIKSSKNVEIEFTHDEQINDNNLVIESPEGSVKQVLLEKHQTYNVYINGTLVNYTTNYLISSQITINSGNFFNSESNENIFVIIDGGVLTLNPGVELNKNFNSTTNNLFSDQENNSDRRLAAAIIEQETNNDNTSDEEETNIEEENSEQEEEISVDYGQNSAIVVLGTGKVIINGIKITSSFVNSHGIVAINGGKVIISNSTISTEGDNSKGIYSLYEGSINATNVIISSLGENSPNIATGIGTGSINAEKMKLSTLNFRSPLIDTGDGGIISIKNSTGTTNISNIIIIDGNSNTSINNCIFSGVGQGILGYDDAGILIYQKIYDNNKL